MGHPVARAIAARPALMMQSLLARETFRRISARRQRVQLRAGHRRTRGGEKLRMNARGGSRASPQFIRDATHADDARERRDETLTARADDDHQHSLPLTPGRHWMTKACEPIIRRDEQHDGAYVLRGECVGRAARDLSFALAGFERAHDATD